MSAVSSVALERELRDAVANYGSAGEIDLAIENTKLLSAIAPRPSDRALCLMRMVALHQRLRVIAQ